MSPHQDGTADGTSDPGGIGTVVGEVARHRDRDGTHSAEDSAGSDHQPRLA
jgi:hypothetical protein